MKHPEVLLFDLGGVIVPWVGTQAMSALTGRDPNELMPALAAQPIFAAHEIGQCGDLIFAEFMIEFLKLDIGPDAFISLWNSWVLAPYSGTSEALKTLRSTHQLACLSNTNAPHWNHLKGLIDLDEHLDFAYASHLIGVSKPDPESFQIPLRGMGVNPSCVWYFDDTEINVHAARDAGMTAFHVDRNVGVLPKLMELGILADKL